MPRDPEAFADMVVMTVKSALAPVLERLAAAEARLAQLPTVEKTVGEVRDRVLAVETKAAILPPSVPLSEPVNLAPVLERVSAAEARLSVLGDLRDRVVAIESKSVSPAVAGPSPAELELSIRDRVEPVMGQIGSISERIAVLETKAPVSGPPGRDGNNGKDGQDGKNGADGMGWDDLIVKHDGERSFTMQLVNGDRVKDAGTFTVPVDIYRGVYSEGKTYDRGDGVTWGGSEWHCNEQTTAKPGEGSKAWTLKVKRGRDGKDGRDAAGGLPVVSLRGAS